MAQLYIHWIRICSWHFFHHKWPFSGVHIHESSGKRSINKLGVVLFAQISAVSVNPSIGRSSFTCCHIITNPSMIFNLEYHFDFFWGIPYFFEIYVWTLFRIEFISLCSCLRKTSIFILISFLNILQTCARLESVKLKTLPT